MNRPRGGVIWGGHTVHLSELLVLGASSIVEEPSFSIRFQMHISASPSVLFESRDHRLFQRGLKVCWLQNFQAAVLLNNSALCRGKVCVIWSPSLVKLNSPHDPSVPAAALHSKADGNALLPFRVYIMNSTWSYRTPLSTHSNSKILSGLNIIAERNLGDLCCSPIFWQIKESRTTKKG